MDECKYHVVFIPKCRRKTLYGELRPHLGEVFRKLALQKESRVEEGHLMPDHVHMMISIPPKYAVSQVVGFIKGKSAIHLARVYGEKKRNFVGQHFWARGCAFRRSRPPIPTDRDHLFRSIATSVARVLTAPLDDGGDVSLLKVGQARREAVPVVNRRDPRVTRSALTAGAAARAGGPC